MLNEGTGLPEADRLWLRPVADAAAYARGRPFGVREILPHLRGGFRGRDDWLFHAVRALIQRGLVDGDVNDNQQTVTVRRLTPAGVDLLGDG